MRILVTGAAGFVGYAMAALLIEHGHHVIGLTRSPASALPPASSDSTTTSTHASLPAALAEVDGVVEIRDNLHARITEARQQGWLGAVDGLQISLTGTRQKLA